MEITIGTMVKVCRALRGYTQKEVAETIEISIPYLSLIERDLRTPTIGTLEIICDFLDIPVYVMLMVTSEVYTEDENRKHELIRLILSGQLEKRVGSDE